LGFKHRSWVISSQGTFPSNRSLLNCSHSIKRYLTAQADAAAQDIHTKYDEFQKETLII